MALIALAPATAASQGFRATGRVGRVQTRDTLPLANQRVILHEVGRGGGAPIDSARTDARGQYALRSPRGDSTAVYFVSVQYGGVSYVSVPLREMKRQDLKVEPLVVYDTSSTAPAIRVEQRHLIVRAPDKDGSRHVLELIILRNLGTMTRIANDTIHPVWAAALPRHAAQFEVGESDVSDRAVVKRGDSIFVFAPVPPGDKQVIVQYVLPPSDDRLTMSLDQPMERLNVLVDDTLATLARGPLVSVGYENMEGSRFARFAGEHTSAGDTVEVRFRPGPFSLARYWWVIVALAGMAFAAGIRLAFRGRPVPVVSAEGIAAEIVALDEAHEAGRGDAATYQTRRAELKARLNAMLASEQSKP